VKTKEAFYSSNERREKMKRMALLCLLASLIVTTAYATNTATATGNWTDATVWGGGSAPINDGDEVKIGGSPANLGLTVTVNTSLGSFSTKVVGTFNSCDLQVTGGDIGFGRRVQIGSGPGQSAGTNIGYLTQTGGTVEINRSCEFDIAYKASGGGPGEDPVVGTYTISGGTFQGTTNTSFIVVGGRSGVGMTGTFRVIGTGGTINQMGDLRVAKSSNGAGTGIMRFDLNASGAVSRVKVRDSYIDSATDANAVARLVVDDTLGAPAADVVLIENTSANAVSGDFDTINGGISRIVSLGGNTFFLSYTYVAGGDAVGNDIALVLIPEPATIVLLAIGGLIAAKRRK